MTTLLAVLALVVGGMVDARAGSSASQPRALFFGDSLFVGTGTHPTRPVEVQTTSRTLHWAGHVDALGGTGYTTGGNAHRPYLQRLRTDGALKHHWQVIVLEGGTNDAHHGSLPDLLTDARATVDYVMQQQPWARVVLVGAFAPEGPTPSAYQVTDRVLAQVARERGLLYVSQVGYGATEGDGFYSADHFHPNATGYAVLGRALAAAIARG